MTQKAIDTYLDNYLDDSDLLIDDWYNLDRYRTTGAIALHGSRNNDNSNAVLQQDTVAHLQCKPIVYNETELQRLCIYTTSKYVLRYILLVSSLPTFTDQAVNHATGISLSGTRRLRNVYMNAGLIDECGYTGTGKQKKYCWKGNCS